MRIALSGSHSVGKTTLLRLLDLSQHCKIQELPRAEIEKRGVLPHEMSARDFFDFQLSLVRQQKKAEQGDFIIDRSIYDFLAYVMDHRDYRWVEAYIDRCYRPYDYIFYLPIEFGLQADGIRKPDDNYQKLIDYRLRAIFKNRRIPIIELSGSTENRLKQFNDVLGI